MRILQQIEDMKSHFFNYENCVARIFDCMDMLDSNNFSDNVKENIQVDSLPEYLKELDEIEKEMRESMDLYFNYVKEVFVKKGALK